MRLVETTTYALAFHHYRGRYLDPRLVPWASPLLALQNRARAQPPPVEIKPLWVGQLLHRRAHNRRDAASYRGRPATRGRQRRRRRRARRPGRRLAVPRLRCGVRSGRATARSDHGIVRPLPRYADWPAKAAQPAAEGVRKPKPCAESCIGGRAALGCCRQRPVVPLAHRRRRPPHRSRACRLNIGATRRRPGRTAVERDATQHG